MTSNQIEYAKHVENSRHNLAVEGENVRHNRETERQGRTGLTETVRHNKATEKVSVGSLEETKRHNKVWERQNLASIENAYTVGMRQASASLASASAAYESAKAAQKNAGANVINAETARLRQIEDARHNAAMETQGYWKIGSDFVGNFAKTVASFKGK